MQRYGVFFGACIVGGCLLFSARAPGLLRPSSQAAEAQSSPVFPGAAQRAAPGRSRPAQPAAAFRPAASLPPQAAFERNERHPLTEADVASDREPAPTAGLRNRFAPEHAIADPDQDGPLMAASGSEPEFFPPAWDRPEARFGNNCYAYALDDLNLFRMGSDDFPQPGSTAGLSAADPATYTAQSLRNRAVADGLRPAPAEAADKPAPDGFYKVALVIAPGEDYHWYRQDASGYWSHKLGDDRVQDFDAAGQPITDPRSADHNYRNQLDPDTGIAAGFNYTTFAGFFYVPQGGIRLASIQKQ